MMKKNIRLTAAVLAAALFISSNVFATTTAEYDQQINDIKSQQAANDAETERLNAELNALTNELSEKEAYQQTLVEKIENYREKIDLANARINELNDEITYLEEQIELADQRYDETLEKLKERLRAMYTSGGDLTTLEILLDSTSLHDFSMRAEAMQSITEHDTMLMNEIMDYLTQTKEQRDELRTNKEELAEQKKGLESDQAELQVLEAENAQLIEELNIQSALTADEIAENERAQAEYDSALESLIAERTAQAERDAEALRQQQAANNSSGTIVNTSTGSGDSSLLNTGSLSFSWPLAGYGYESITQYYGNNGHRGLDIGIPYGTPIYASEAGQVISAEYHYSWGNNVLIWHNSTYSTRYAHCSSLAVSAGQYVSKGQVVGYAGSTGNSTGNHLHFEVYQNGTRVNPSSFV